MRTRRGVEELFLLTVLGGFGALAACGSRTGLPVAESAVDAAAPDSVGLIDAPDVTVPLDTSPASRDASFDALPPIDVIPIPDVVVNGCPDPGATLIYVVSGPSYNLASVLYSFYPPTGAFAEIGGLECPVTQGGATVFSMAVDKGGTAFVVYDDGELFQVSTKTAACVPTPYVPGQGGVTNFGMSFVGSSSGTGDTLYVAPWNKTELATVATTSFLLSVVGPFGPESIAGAELSGTGDGRLFAFYSTGDPRTGLNSAVAQIDPTSATVLANNDLNSLPQGAGWAFAFWGGSFYLFTAPISRGTAETMVTRFNPADLSQTTVATFGGMGAGSSQVIVGAGVSTCAPMQ